MHTCSCQSAWLPSGPKLMCVGQSSSHVSRQVHVCQTTWHVAWLTWTGTRSGRLELLTCSETNKGQLTAQLKSALEVRLHQLNRGLSSDSATIRGQASISATICSLTGSCLSAVDPKTRIPSPTPCHHLPPCPLVPVSSLPQSLNLKA